MALGMGVITKASSLNRPEVNIVGPIMQQLEIFKLAKIENVFDGVEFKTQALSTANTVNIEYMRNGERYIASVVRRPDGIISCDFCSGATYRIAWCHHIHAVIRHHADEALYYMERGKTEPMNYCVPIVPTDGIFVSIEITQNDLHGDLLNIGINVTERGGDEEDVVLPIGILRRMQFGTIEIRSMVVDFMDGWLSNPDYFDTLTHPSEDDTVTEFTRRFYAAETGTSLAVWKLDRAASADVPSF